MSIFGVCIVDDCNRDMMWIMEVDSIVVRHNGHFLSKHKKFRRFGRYITFYNLISETGGNVIEIACYDSMD